MSNLPSTVLSNIIAKAAARPVPADPALVHLRSRLSNCSPESIVILDVSGSMAAPAWGGYTKIALLRQAVIDAWTGERLIVFSSRARVIDSPAGIPEPEDSTAMHEAFALAAQYRPSRTLVVSDGEPDDPAAALAAAEQVSGQIDVLYIGPDSASGAIEFMRRLVRVGCGRMETYDVSKSGARQQQLSAHIRALLPGPGGIK